MATERVKLLDPATEAADAKTIAARYRCEYVDLREASIDRLPPSNYRWALEMQIEDPDGNVLRLGSEAR